MKCPICETKTLHKRHRNDVLIDICERCRGIWVYHSELEKLIAHPQQEIDKHERFYQESESAYKPERPHAAAHIRQEGQSTASPKKDKKKGFLTVFEIFGWGKGQ